MAVPITPVRLGDVVRLKKPHPCGVNEWEITRLGADLKIRCKGCDRSVMLPRYEFDRRFRGFIERAAVPLPDRAEQGSETDQRVRQTGPGEEAEGEARQR